MKPTEAMKIVENADNHSAAEIRQANKVLKDYAPKTAQDITVAIGISPPRKLPKSKPTKEQRKKAEMAYGGMSQGKKHMYAAGGMVKDNPGLKALKAASPTAYNKITGK